MRSTRIVGHRPAVLDRFAQVAGAQVAQVEHELDGQRLVEPEARAKLEALLGRCLLLQGGLARVAGDDPGEDEDDRYYAEQHGDARQQAAEDEADHLGQVPNSIPGD